MAKAASIGGTDGGSTVPHLIMLLVLHGTGATSAPAADTVAESIVLKAADGIELKIEVSPDTLAYFVSVDGEVWLTSGPVAMTSGGVTYTSDCPDKNNCLSLSGALVKSSGTDPVYGTYEEVAASWKCSGGEMLTTFRSYMAEPILVFEQIFPSAITGAASQSTALSVSTAFPSWLMDTADLHGFAGKNQGATNGPWASTDFQGGIAGGVPLVLYKKVVGTNGDTLRSVVMSPLNNFMAATIASPEPHLFAHSRSEKISAAGLFASVTEIPAGYTHPTVLVGAHGGPTPALMAWGDVLLSSTGKTRTNYANHPTDLSLTHIGYWTDNGAWYHYLCSECCGGGGAQNACPCPQECGPGKTMENTMLQVKADLASRKIPIKYFMFDSWWYPKAGDPGANSTKPDWPIRDGNGMLTWTPEPQVFPDGLSYWLGMPTFLHARYLAPETPYRDIPELKDKMICEGNASSPPPAPTPTPPGTSIPPCKGAGYCKFAGVYCAGATRKQLFPDAALSLAACEAECTKDAACNCVSWTQAFREGGTKCRLFSGADSLQKSSSGFSAFVKPSEISIDGSLSLVASQNNLPSRDGMCLPVDKAVFKHMMQGVHNWKPFVYEQDWISTTYGKSKSLTNSTTIGDAWLTGMNDAAVELNMTIQYSMSYTPAIIHSSKLSAVTQIRGSGDYTAGGSQWRIGLTSMTYWALGAVASKDTLWTVEHQPGCPKSGSYNCTEPNLAIQMINAVLSGGPVGPGDRLNVTDAVMTLRSCDANGRLLRGDRPHAPLDLAFAYLLGNSHPEAGRVDSSDPSGPLTIWSSYSNHTYSRYHYIFGADAAEIYPKDLLLAESDTTQEYLAIIIAETPKPTTETGSVTWGSSAAVQTVTPTVPLKLAPAVVATGTTAGVVAFSYWLLAPIAPDQKVVLLGEMDKVVPVSTQRFHEVQAGEWSLSGAPAETVVVSFVAMGEVNGSLEVKTVSCVLSEQGECELSCASTTCTCM